jgi:hypothetical protein
MMRRGADQYDFVVLFIPLSNKYTPPGGRSFCGQDKAGRRAGAGFHFGKHKKSTCVVSRHMCLFP